MTQEQLQYIKQVLADNNNFYTEYDGRMITASQAYNLYKDSLAEYCKKNINCELLLNTEFFKIRQRQVGQYSAIWGIEIMQIVEIIQPTYDDQVMKIKSAFEKNR